MVIITNWGPPEQNIITDEDLSKKSLELGVLRGTPMKLSKIEPIRMKGKAAEI